MANPPNSRPPRRAAGYIVWPYLLYMLLATGMIIGVSFYYLIPVLRDYNDSPATSRNLIRAHALLLMSLLLVILGLMLLLTFRISRYFSPRRQSPRSSTPYIDAWAESAKRMKTPPDDES